MIQWTIYDLLVCNSFLDLNADENLSRLEGFVEFIDIHLEDFCEY